MNKSDSPIFFTLLLITQTLLGILHDGVDCLVVCYQLCLCVEYYQLVARVTTNCTFCSVYLMSSLDGTAPIIHSTHTCCHSHMFFSHFMQGSEVHFGVHLQSGLSKSFYCVSRFVPICTWLHNTSRTRQSEQLLTLLYKLHGTSGRPKGSILLRRLLVQPQIGTLHCL